MPTLRLVKLECVKKDDTVGKDEIDVRVDGVTLVGPLSMGRNDVVSLNATTSFTSSAKVNLLEEDSGLNGSDDDLGTLTIKDTLAGLGDLTGEFHARTGADYHLTYRVDA